MEDDHSRRSYRVGRSDFNPRPPCGGRPAAISAGVISLAISIHVPRVEDDLDICTLCMLKLGFQSTSPVWRTTRSKPRYAHRSTNFNPRPPCGGRPYRSASFYNYKKFQSTSPVWRTTQLSAGPQGSTCHFNPRPPCGGRLAAFLRPLSCGEFQSTSPVWRTTKPLTVSDLAIKISIHVPRVEDDTVKNVYNMGGEEFQSTSPVWRTTFDGFAPSHFSGISIHVPRVEDDRFCGPQSDNASHFNPRPPCGGRRRFY